MIIVYPASLGGIKSIALAVIKAMIARVYRFQ